MYEESNRKIKGGGVILSIILNNGGGAMTISFRLFPEACIERIIERAIEEGKLFEDERTKERKDNRNKN